MKEWSVFSTLELERIKMRKIKDLHKIMNTEKDHEMAFIRTEKIAEDVEKIDMELRARP